MATLEEIIQGSGETLVVHNHLQQQLTFVRGGGVEFLPVFDEGNVRKSLIESIAKTSKLKLMIDPMLIKLISDGRLLLYLRPIGRGGYKIQHYSAREYRCYYDANGEMERAVIVYCYNRMESGQKQRWWVRLEITAQFIQQEQRQEEFQFDQPYTPINAPLPNELGFIPCVECLNSAPADRELGRSDFEPLRSQIESHDDLLAAILDNVIFFCNSPILTTREASEITENMFNGAMDAKGEIQPMGSERDSVAWRSGFRDNTTQFRRSRRANRRKLKRIVGSIEPDELFQQLGVNAVPGDVMIFNDAQERQLREALGGLLERGIETATETRVVYGKVMSTAAKKQEALFTYGLCRLFEMAILAEEALFVSSGGTLGLIPHPQGDRTITFRITPVFVQTTNDYLQRSIVSRNLMRQGVNAKQALKFVFPDKSENELDEMVGSGGLPTEYLQSAIGLLQQLSQTIDPLTGMPLSDPVTRMPIAYTLIPFITGALNYGDQFNTVTATDPSSAAQQSAAINAAGLRSIFEQLRAAAGNGVGSLGAEDIRQPLPEPGSTISGSANDAGSASTLGYANPAVSTTGSELPAFFDLSRSPILSAARNAFRKR